MSRTLRTLIAFAATLTVLAVPVSRVPAVQAAPPGDSVDFTFTGAHTYTNGGPLVSGDVRVVRSADGKVREIAGRGRLPGVSGGDASFSMRLTRILMTNRYMGFIHVRDRMAGFKVLTPAISTAVVTSGQTVSGRLDWVDPQSRQPYVLVWSVNDAHNAPPATLRIDPALAPAETEVPDGRGGTDEIAVVADSRGVKSTFVANEAVIRPANQGELTRFLARTRGAVLDTQGSLDWRA